MSGFARARVARTLPAFLASYPGVAAESVLRHASITPDLVVDPEGLLDFKRWVELAELAATKTGDAAFGAKYANQVPWPDLGVLGYVIVHSPTLGDALANATRYLGLQQNVASASMEVVRGEARLTYRIDHPEILEHAQHTESVMAFVVRICREALRDPAWGPRAVRFEHGAHRSVAAHRRLFRCDVAFDQPRNMIALSAADLKAPMPSADPSLLPILLDHAETRLAKTPRADDFEAQISRAIAESLRTGDAAVVDVAKRLGISPRTFQRRLQDQGLSFTGVLAHVRLSLAKQYLADPTLTLTEAAFLLGYSELSAFSRAFRRWTGQNAVEFRRTALTAGRR